MLIQLDVVEARTLGSLVEKALTTREQYPLTFNSLLNACNQKSSRDPVMTLDCEALGRAVQGLVEKGLVERVQAPGDRVPKFRHDIHRLLNTDDAKTIGAIVVLLLRGPQTAGEIKVRTERLCEFSGTAEAEALLQELAARPVDPFVARLPRPSGQKESRYYHLFSGTPAPVAQLPAATAEKVEDRLARLELRVAALESLLGEKTGATEEKDIAR